MSRLNQERAPPPGQHRLGTTARSHVFFFFKKEQTRCQKCRVDKLDMHFAPFWLRSKYLKFRLNEISVCRAAPSPNVQTHPIRYTRLTQKTELALRRNRVIDNFVLAVLKRHTSFVTLALF